MTARGLLRAVVYVSLLLGVATGVQAQQGDAPAATGTIAGQVVDASTGDPIIEAGVEVIGSGKQIRTDLDGRYNVKMPPGTYAVRFFAPLYEGARIEKVVVMAGKTATAEVPLKPQGQAGVEVVEVVAQAAKAAEATQIVKRQKASVVSDNIGAETIRKAPDANAAEIVQRVPAVTIKDDKFIFVRGLGERYSSAVLDGSRLPSPDPERRVVPLDLFPAEFLESISVIKTYTPDLPGDFSAGLADIELLDFPEQLTYGLGLSTAGNSNTSLQDFTTYRGDSHDTFGFGGNKRALPDVIPDHSISSETAARRQLFGRSFPVIWETDEVTAPVDYNVNGQIGNRWGPWGARLAFTYGNKWRRRNERQRQFLQANSFDTPEPTAGDDFEYDRDEFKSRLGAVLTSSYEISRNHHLSFRSLLDRSSTDEVLTGRGISEQIKLESLPTQLQYKQDELAFGQLGGQHHFDVVDVDWRTAFSRTTQNIPDWRITNRVIQDIGAVASDDSNGGSRIFGDLTEYLSDSHLDFTVPFKTQLPFTDVWSGLPAKIKFGPAYANRKRDSSLRIFTFTKQASPIDIDLTAPFNQVYGKDNIGGGPPFPILFDEVTQPQNAFQAREEELAGYGMIELPIIKDKLRLIAGARVEYSYLQLDITDQSEQARKVIRNHTDPMPGVNLVYTPRPDMNVRLAWSQTVSRPEFRELSPAIYPAPRGLRGFVGNSTLDQTDISSYDVRWEWFFGPSELVSLSGFYKTIDAPIEQAVFLSGSAAFDTFQQNQDATLYGFEIEARKNLGTLAPWLEGLSFQTNVTYVASEVTALVKPASVDPPEAAVFRKRDLQGQAPFVVNAALEYTQETVGTVRLLYNTVGNTIARVQDRTMLPDFVEKRRDSLDLVYLKKVEAWGVPLTVKLSVENMLNDKFLTTVGGVTQEDYRTGVTAGLGVSYTY